MQVESKKLVVNPVKLAKQERVIAGDHPLKSMARLMAICPQLDGQVVNYELNFISLSENKCAITGKLSALVKLHCQKCLAELAYMVNTNVSLLPVSDIEDWNEEDDVSGYEPIILIENEIDVYWLLEEEILLALPLYPKHDICDISLEQMN